MTQLLTETPLASWDRERKLEWLRSTVALCRRHRLPFERLFHLCYRFWAGDQWSEYVPGVESRWDRRPLRATGLDTVAHTDNQLPTYARHHLSVCAQNMPRMKVRPAGDEPEDKLRAAFASKLVVWREEEDNEEWLRELELLNLVGVGESLRRTSFDSQAGDPVARDGDLLTEVVNIFSYYKDPYSVNRWPPRYLIEADVRHVEWVKQRYGATLEPERLEDTQQYENDLVMAVQRAPQLTRQKREGIGESVLVYRLSAPPSHRNPWGRVWVFTDKQLLDEHELQVSGQRAVWPYSLASWYPLPNRLYPMGMIELVMLDQIELNTLITLLYEAALASVRGDLITSGFDQTVRSEVYDARTGAKQYKLGPETKFERVQLAADWQQAEVRKNEKLRSMKEKTGTSEPSLGQPLAKQVTVGEIQIVSGSNIRDVSWHLGRYAERHLTAITKQKLALLREYVVAPRLVNLPGPAGESELVAFIGADLEGATDVIAVPSPYMSPGMKQQATFNAWKEGLLGPWKTIGEEVSARKTLLAMGLEEAEQEIANSNGPLEEAEGIANQFRKMRVEAEAAAIQAEAAAAQATVMQAQMAMMPQAPAALAGGQDGGQPL